MKTKQTSVQGAGRVLREQGCCFAGGTVSPVMCPADGQQKDDKKGQTEDKPRQSQKQPGLVMGRWSEPGRAERKGKL